MRAEVKVATMLVQHNIPLAVADELTPLFQDIFSDSEIAKSFSSRRMKTACIINGAIAPMYQQLLVESMRNGPFSIAVDKSTKRKASLGEYCSFCSTEYRQIVKHVNTRWLSLERAVSRVLQQYEALKSYFLSEGISLTECMSTVTCEFQCVITCPSLHACR